MLQTKEEKVEAAKRAYAAYGKAVDYKNYQGLPMPKWEDLTPEIRGAWVDASETVDYFSRSMGYEIIE